MAENSKGKAYVILDEPNARGLCPIREVPKEGLELPHGTLRVKLSRLEIGDQVIVGKSDNVAVAAMCGTKLEDLNGVLTKKAKVHETTNIAPVFDGLTNSFQLPAKSAKKFWFNLTVVQERGDKEDDVKKLVDKITKELGLEKKVQEFVETALTFLGPVAGIAAGYAVKALATVVAGGIQAIFGDQLLISSTVQMNPVDSARPRNLLFASLPGKDDGWSLDDFGVDMNTGVMYHALVGHNAPESEKHPGMMRSVYPFASVVISRS